MLQKFFAAYPNTHIAKFLIKLGLHRKAMLILYKLLYRSWFGVVNRIQILNQQVIRDLRICSPSRPFLIVENHSATPDVMMHLGLWGHLGKNTFTFIAEGSYSPRYPFSTSIIHFSEMVPRFGSGQDSINRMTARLLEGDIVNIFPAGTYPSRKFANTGFVQEGYSGAARVAFEYEKITGKALEIVPVCSLGANLAYPPRRHRKKYIQKMNSKILIKFGTPFI